MEDNNKENQQNLIELQSGTTLNNGKYVIEKKIGAGGFGITYKARQSGLNRTVCVKEYFLAGKCGRNTCAKTVFLQNITPEFYDKYRRSFVSEAQMLASLNHPNIVDIIDIFDENNTSYMVMPFIEGTTLQNIVEKNGPLQYTEAINYIGQITNAIDFIHKQHILHRDIKPDNIMITSDYKAILIDFGNAREFEQDQVKAHTSIFTRGYAPPEQYNPNTRKGSYTDIYAIGATLYYVLTGHEPIDSATRTIERLKEPKELCSDIPENANRTIMKAMEPQPENRHQTIQEFIDDMLNVHPSDIVDDKKNKADKTSSNDIDNVKHIDDNVGKDSQPITPPKKKKRKALNIILIIISLGLLTLIGVNFYGAYKDNIVYNDYIWEGNFNLEQELWSAAVKSYENALSIEQYYSNSIYKTLGMFDDNAEGKISKTYERQSLLGDKDDYLAFIRDGDRLANNNQLTKAKIEYAKAVELEKKYENSTYADWFNHNIQDKLDGIDKRIKENERFRNELKTAGATGKSKGHYYVDLGLNVCWATCNVGANSPEEYGKYYAWGETIQKVQYDESTSESYGEEMYDISRSSSYDAARANWGGNWRMPTRTEFNELISRCTWIWTTQKGMNGYKVTGPNGNNIFLPAAGGRGDKSLYGAESHGYYWSSTPNESNSAYSYAFDSSNHGEGSYYRSYGFSVRPVIE